MNKLFYSKPAKFWKQALPLGNGKIGLIVYGGKRTEIIAVNDSTLWSGYPKDQDNPESLKYLGEVRKLIFGGRNAEADKLAEQILIGGYSESYLPLGRIKIRFGKSAGKGYSRELDLDAAEISVKGGGIQRYAFASYPDNVAVYRVRSDKRINFSISLSGKLKCGTVVDKTLNLVGRAPDYVAPNYLRTEKTPVVYNENKGMAFCMRLEVVTDGKKNFRGNKIIVSDATETCVYIVTETGFCGYNKMPVTDTEYCLQNCKKRLDATDKNYEIIKKRHISDYSTLYLRQSVKIANESDLATDVLVKNAKKGSVDKSLIELFYNYGKYLTIAGSRKGCQPLNLQGIWNNSVRPPWSSNYTANINVQMNYWGTSSSNLADCLEPYIEMVYECMLHGEKTARVNYGAEGFACNHNVDIWRKTAPVRGSANYMYSPLCGVWLANELYAHLCFDQLDEYREKVEKIVKEAARFADGYLTEHDGFYVTCPSPSPENVFINGGARCKLDYASSFETALIKQCFKNYLQIDGESAFAVEIKEKSAKLYPFTIGNDGLCEWHKHYETPEKGHRHFSPLYGFYPGGIIGYRRDKDLTDGVRKLFRIRVGNTKRHCGWSSAWAICIAARLRDGETAKKIIDDMMSHSVFYNLFGMHPPFLFQIDGNLGFVAGINEMLITSEDGVIELLPALPESWQNGIVKGMRTPTGHLIDFEWKNGMIVSLNVVGGTAVKFRITERVSADLIKTLKNAEAEL